MILNRWLLNSFSTLFQKCLKSNKYLINIFLIKMGPISPYGPKQFGRLTQQDIFRQSVNFIKEQSLCAESDQIFNTLKLVIAKINIYGHRHLLDHIRNTKDNTNKIKFLTDWKSLHFEDLDLLFQNLIRKKITRIDDEQMFGKIDLHQKYSEKNTERAKQIYRKGQSLISERKVAVIIFVEGSATKIEGKMSNFYKSKQYQLCLFEIIMERLKEIGDKLGFPPTYLFYNSDSYSKISDYLKRYKYSENIQLCQHTTHPILNLNGNLCLKAADSGDVIQMPNGSGDFIHCSIKGVNILEKLKLDKVEYVSCVDCQNILQMVIDPYVVGLLDSNKDGLDLMYKCTYPEDQRETIFRRVALHNNEPKADTLNALNSYINYNNKNRMKNKEITQSSPVWMNSLIFSLPKVCQILQNTNKVSQFPRPVTYTMKFANYWSPIDNQMHQGQSCYVFQKEISDLLINNLFKSQAVMVQREQQYLPVISSKQNVWDYAYKQYLKKKENKIPFYDRFRTSQKIEQQPKIKLPEPQAHNEEPLTIKSENIHSEPIQQDKEIQ